MTRSAQPSPSSPTVAVTPLPELVATGAATAAEAGEALVIGLSRAADRSYVITGAETLDATSGASSRSSDAAELAEYILDAAANLQAPATAGAVTTLPAPASSGLSRIVLVGLDQAVADADRTDFAPTPVDRVRVAAASAARAILGAARTDDGTTDEVGTAAVETTPLGSAGLEGTGAVPLVPGVLVALDGVSEALASEEAASSETSGAKPEATVSAEDVLSAAAEGWVLGSYTYRSYFSGAKGRAPEFGEVRLASDVTDKTAAELVRRGATVSRGTCTARDLVNTPPNDLFPEAYAARVAATAEQLGLTVEIYDDERLEAEGFGGLCAVGGGSARKPRLVRLEHRGSAPRPGDDRPIALVGKGITFDTGGISLKPGAGMEEMTMDMGGSAAVVGALCAAAELDVPGTIVGWLALAENMPSSSAYRPGDVITQYGGTTVHVLNTDAEGRLVLADAIARASEEKPSHLIDVATLTGAQLVALGKSVIGVMGTPNLRDAIAAAGVATGEPAWPMPLSPEVCGALESPLADLPNIGNGRMGGMLLAGAFLRHFVPKDITWAHVDIAGPAYHSSSASGLFAQGGTGVPVRTFVSVLESLTRG